MAAVAWMAATACGADLEPDQVLDEVVARLPREALTIRGSLLVRRTRGIPVENYLFEMDLRWGETPSLARYRILTPEGVPLEGMEVERGAEEAAVRRYSAGSPPQEAPAPPPGSSLRGSDLSWTDLSLDFLWWRGAVAAAPEEVKGRKCLVFDVPAPAGTDTGYASVRLWIDAEALLMLKAEGRDARGVPLRTLWVRSFKKIRSRWMIRDIEVQRYPLRHRTKLTVREVEEDGQPLPDEDPATTEEP